MLKEQRSCIINRLIFMIQNLAALQAKRSLTRQTISIFWQHIRRYQWLFWLIIASVLAVTWVQTYVSLLYRDLIDLLSRKGVGVEALFDAGVSIIIFILLINLSEVVLWRVIDFINNFFLARVMRDVTNTCYRFLHQHSYGFFSSHFVGSLVTKVKRYERALEAILMQLCFDLGRSFVVTAMIVAVLLARYPLYGYIFLGWSIIYLVFVYYFAQFKTRYDKVKTKMDTETTAQLADSITNNVNIKTFSGYGFENERFAKVTNNLFAARRKAWNFGTVGEFVQAILIVGLEFGIVYLSLTDWKAGLLTVGDLVLLQTYLVRMYEKLWNAGKYIRTVYEAIADANEMTALLVQPRSVVDAEGAGNIAVSKGAIAFVDASFKYGERSVLRNFNLQIAPGERVALVGPSGGGKSTLLKLLFRFYNLSGGKILIDGQDIATVTQDSLRDALSLVPQDPILFHRPILENIRYARQNATDEEVIQAAKLAHAHEFIEKLSHGYQTMVGERGIKLSGGERQRIAIARAILKNAPILILDEATSSLDSESEMLIQDALHTLMAGRTTIVVAHRLSTIMAMDRIIVVKDGEIIEEGKHEELVKARQGTYQRLWEIQAGGFSPATE